MISLFFYSGNPLYPMNIYAFMYYLKVTVPLFLLFSAMLTCKQYFGEPIECYSKGIPDHIMNTYCWTHGTYTVKDLEHVTVIKIVFKISNFKLSLLPIRDAPPLPRR